MHLKILSIILFSGLAVQKGVAQPAANDTTKSTLRDSSTQALSTEGRITNLSSQHVAAKLFRTWLASGKLGAGIGLGGINAQPLYLCADSSKPGLALHPSGKAFFENSIHVNGTTTTKILTITGGADLAEPFPMSQANIPAGAVVVIDEDNPGKLKLCEKAYDTRVAGVISGAAGVRAGLTMKQEGALEEGRDVALTGRVYALATTVNGAIAPGDLLTTSAQPGHAMKATDRSLSHGAILGKAMTRLAAGKGLVLVLVNLQ
ncbi:hypothetical protein HUU05_05590 [candidate division KSB1 bacterium]|nr:hypothetical protein [candidate division KSB1 bacterium]